MEHCKDHRDCENKLNTLSMEVHGADGSNGLKGNFNEFKQTFDLIATKAYNAVPKYWLWVALIAIVLPTYGTMVKVWAGQESDYLKYASIDRVQKVETRVKIIEDRLCNVQSSIARMEKKQEEHQKELRIDIRSILTTVSAINTKVDSLEVKVESLDTKVDSLEVKVESLDTKVEALEQTHFHTNN